MSSPFDQAEIYMKDTLSIPIEISIKALNQQLASDKKVPGLMLLVTGGQAINTYFPNQPSLRTHDYDLKLIAPKNISYTLEVRNRMTLLGRGISRYLAIALNDYIKTILPKVVNDMKTKFGLDLVLNGEGEVFSSSTNLRNELLNIVTFKVKNSEKARTNSIADVYAVDPRELYHYDTFTGMSNSNPILSEQAGDYYIPFQMVNGIPIAGMGYLIWDTLRMVEFSKETSYYKLPKYEEKRDAIFNSLNTPNTNMSCSSMKGFVTECEQNFQVCSIDSKRYNSMSELLKYGINEGVIPSDPVIMEKIRNTFDLGSLCETVKKLL